MRLRLALGLVAAGLLSCSPRSEPLGSAPARIIDGTADTDDRAVVLLIAIAPSGEGTICTGTVVSPHVVATAAHCVDPGVLVPLIGSDYYFLVFLGDDNDDPAQYNDVANFVDVAETAFNRAFPLTGKPVHDVGAVVTAAALPPAPIPINRTALGADVVGQPVRILGYGRTVANDVGSGSAKHEAGTTIAGVDAEQLWLQGTPSTCEGDSGGPTLIVRNGVESLAGIHSYGDSLNCAGKSYDMRVDADLPALIDPLIAEYDPDFTLPGDGSDAAAGGGGAGGEPAGGGQGGANGESDESASGCATASPGPSNPIGWSAFVAFAILLGCRARRR